MNAFSEIIQQSQRPRLVKVQSLSIKSTLKGASPNFIANDLKRLK